MTISARGAAIKQAAIAWDELGGEKAFGEIIGRVYDAGYAAAEKDRAWVPVEERLPDEGQTVWVTRKADGAVVKRVFDAPYGPSEFRQTFTAWMPYFEPSPYVPTNGGTNDER